MSSNLKQLENCLIKISLLWASYETDNPATDVHIDAALDILEDVKKDYAQLASRDALIERLANEGGRLAGLLGQFSPEERAKAFLSLDALVAELEQTKETK